MGQCWSATELNPSQVRISYCLQLYDKIQITVVTVNIIYYFYCGSGSIIYFWKDLITLSTDSELNLYD
jgi:hypothetical protein